MAYLIFKSIHFLGAISWMAGILYLYRILIYHAENLNEPKVTDLLNTMGYRLSRYIMIPAMVVTILMGLSMIFSGIAMGGWLIVKLMALLGLVGSTAYASWLVKKFKEKREPLPSSKALRYLNEVPTLLMIIIVVMAVFRPF